jgi:hypothetical protein
MGPISLAMQQDFEFYWNWYFEACFVGAFQVNLDFALLVVLPKNPTSG